jgi:hypothetical protein
VNALIVCFLLFFPFTGMQHIPWHSSLGSEASNSGQEYFRLCWLTKALLNFPVTEDPSCDLLLNACRRAMPRSQCGIAELAFVAAFDLGYV